MNERNRGLMTKHTAFTLALALFGAVGARADVTLLNLTNPPAQSDTPFNLTFTANGTTTDVFFEGYQVPSFEDATDISVTTGASGNLLGSAWTFTPAASGSDTSTFNDGTSVPALSLGGVTVGSYDTYSQALTTVVGSTYNVDFNFTNPADSGPSGFIVAVSNGVVATPEPAETLPLLAMMGGVAFVVRKRMARLSK
jgi:hypothetical protein